MAFVGRAPAQSAPGGFAVSLASFMCRVLASMSLISPAPPQSVAKCKIPEFMTSLLLLPETNQHSFLYSDGVSIFSSIILSYMTNAALTWTDQWLSCHHANMTRLAGQAPIEFLRMVCLVAAVYSGHSSNWVTMHPAGLRFRSQVAAHQNKIPLPFAVLKNLGCGCWFAGCRTILWSCTMEKATEEWLLSSVPSPARL